MDSPYAKKSLGQHFLINKGILTKIVDTADPTPDQIIVEIGPGRGALTELLLQLNTKVIAIEPDTDMLDILTERFAGYIQSGHLDLVQDDILQWNETLLKNYDEDYSVVANIPYYITGAILRKFLTSQYQPQSMTLLMQREVIDRIMHRDGKWSLLSVSVAVYGTPTFHGVVRPGSFNPPPTVDSAILRIGGISKNFFTDGDRKIDEESFFKLLRHGFAHKRKQLVTNLAPHYGGRQAILEAFAGCGIDDKARPETISPELWKRLAVSLGV